MHSLTLTKMLKGSRGPVTNSVMTEAVTTLTQVAVVQVLSMGSNNHFSVTSGKSDVDRWHDCRSSAHAP